MSLSIRADTLTQFPTPFEWRSTNQWDGVDGDWSTFFVNIGDSGNGEKGQTFRILISTSASITVVPTGDVCEERDDPNACNQARGIEFYFGSQSGGFEIEESAGWTEEGNQYLGLNNAVGYGSDVGATWGFDTVGLDRASSTSPMMMHQPLALIKPPDNGTYFMGMFGLSNTPINLNNVGYTTFVDNFFNATQIPSMSYGYGVGARYANGGTGVWGSLTLGGFDETRYDANNKAEIQMRGAGENSSLLIGVQSITVSDGSGEPDQSVVEMGSGFDALIDSTLPYLWLPRSVCDTLEELYNLNYDEDTQLYSASENDTEANSRKEMTIKISSTSTTGASSVNIVLPFDALNLNARWPLVENEQKYFPIKRSPNGNVVLGRAFLQEVYLIVDYERKNFTVARAMMPSPLPSPNIIPIISQSLIEDPSNPNPIPEDGGGGLGAGAIAGIVVGVITAIVLVLAVLFFRHRRNKKRAQRVSSPFEKDSDFANPDTRAVAAGTRPDYKDRRASELEDPVWTRSSSAQGFYHRASNSGSERTELVGSPPLGTNEKNRDSYFGKFNPVADPAPLAELPAGDGIAELDARQRPKGHRKRSGGSGSNLQSPRSERPDPIAEEHANEGLASESGLASPLTEEFVTAAPTPAEPLESESGRATTPVPVVTTSAAADAKLDEKDDKEKPSTS